MTDEPVREVLCIPGNGRKYAVEFSYVEEICKDVVLSAMPCLPGYYAGVCNHKGTIVPVVRLEGCIETVSYTHLDVYKRQGNGNEISCAFILGGQDDALCAVCGEPVGEENGDQEELVRVLTGVWEKSE